MVTYKYSGVDRLGNKREGIVEGIDEADAMNRIKEECHIVHKMTVVNTEKKNILQQEVFTKLDMKAFTLMCSQFAIILKAGMSLGRTVELIAEKTANKTLKKILYKVAEDVEGGHPLASSFEEQGKNLLPTIFIETIRAGEASGNLETAFETMHVHFDKQTKMASRIKSALVYPIFVLVIAVVVVIVLMVKVVPTFTEIFDSYGAKLPLITRMLIGISNFFSHYIWVMLSILAIVVIARKIYISNESGKINLAKLDLRMPVFGNVHRLSAASAFANNMYTLLSSGLSITKSVEITSRVIDNYYISSEIAAMEKKLEEGKHLGDCMKESDCIPEILVDMTAVGEETGELEKTLKTIAGYYDEELNQTIDRVLKKLEPWILVFIAAVAGFIVIAIYVAMFEMYGAM